MRAPYANIPRDNITPFSNTHSEKHDLFSSRGTCYYESYLACVLCWDGSCNSAPSECGVLSYVLFSYRGICYSESYLACALCWDIITCLALAASCCQKSRALGGVLGRPQWAGASRRQHGTRVNGAGADRHGFGCRGNHSALGVLGARASRCKAGCRRGDCRAAVVTIDEQGGTT